MNKENTAIVIGAGAAGALCAQLLSKYYSSVTLIERDTEFSSQSIRKGIPQAHHIHNLLYNGSTIIEKLFPGFFDSHTAFEHCPKIEIAQDQRIKGPFGWNPLYSTQKYVKGFTRGFFDYQIYQRIKKNNNVNILLGCDVEGLIYSKNENKVSGVKIKKHGLEENIKADLVVNATGRGSAMLKWLEQIGIEKPEIRRVKSQDGYATRTYRYYGKSPQWKQFAILKAPPFNKRGIYILAAEDNKWVITLVGTEGDYPPANDDGFLEFAKSFNIDAIENLIKNSIPDGPISLFRRMDNVCHFFDKVPNWPAGLIVLGDAICTFNPIFGQGITTAAVSVQLLDKVLSKNKSTGWEKRFHKKLISLMESPWFYSCKEGLKTKPSTFRLKFMKLLYQALPVDKIVHYRMFEVQNLIRPLNSLFHDPLFVLRVFISARLVHNKKIPVDVSLPRFEQEGDVSSF